jgi:ankyrin repeat protein
MTVERPWDDSVDCSPDSQLVTIAHACFDFARAGDTERLREYVERGVPANLTDAAGNTLLMLASYHGHAATVRVLAALGADPDRTNDRGQSPLASAIRRGQDEVVTVLLATGADPDVGKPSGRDCPDVRSGRAPPDASLGLPRGWTHAAEVCSREGARCLVLWPVGRRVPSFVAGRAHGA